jgi:hypothetical protein
MHELSFRAIEIKEASVKLAPTALSFRNDAAELEAMALQTPSA